MSLWFSLSIIEMSDFSKRADTIAADTKRRSQMLIETAEQKPGAYKVPRTVYTANEKVAEQLNIAKSYMHTLDGGIDALASAYRYLNNGSAPVDPAAYKY